MLSSYFAWFVEVGKGGEGKQSWLSWETELIFHQQASLPVLHFNQYLPAFNLSYGILSLSTVVISRLVTVLAFANPSATPRISGCLAWENHTKGSPSRKGKGEPQTVVSELTAKQLLGEIANFTIRSGSLPLACWDVLWWCFCWYFLFFHEDRTIWHANTIIFLFCFYTKPNGSLVRDWTTKGRTKRKARSVVRGVRKCWSGWEDWMRREWLTMLITPERLEAADVHCAALLGMCSERLRNGCEWPGGKTMNKQEEGRWRDWSCGGRWKDRKLGHVGSGRAVRAGLGMESTLQAVSAVAD